MKILLLGSGEMQVTFSPEELDAQIDFMKLVGLKDPKDALVMDNLLNTLQLLRASRK